MTNLIITQNQTQGHCPELPDSSTVCTNSSTCVPGFVGTHSNGVQTGKCVRYNGAVRTCEVFAWCPVENDTHIPDPAFLKDAENFTVLIKNNIWYPKFKFSKRNILPNISASYLKKCLYDRASHPFCPIFRLGSVVRDAGENFQEMAIQGGVMGIQINWDCDLDRKFTACVPKYSFRRLDNRELDHNVSPGYNFRFAKTIRITAASRANTNESFGIRFDILVWKRGREIDITQTILTLVRRGTDRPWQRCCVIL
ncbi:hypothetical protein FKM82_005032 [Ascaphus truei]